MKLKISGTLLVVPASFKSEEGGSQWCQRLFYSDPGDLSSDSHSQGSKTGTSDISSSIVAFSKKIVILFFSQSLGNLHLDFDETPWPFQNQSENYRLSSSFSKYLH